MRHDCDSGINKKYIAAAMRKTCCEERVKKDVTYSGLMIKQYFDIISLYVHCVRPAFNVVEAM